MKSIVFWDVTPCNLAEAYTRSGRASVNLYQNMRRHIIVYSTLHSEKLKSNMCQLI
jgi:hypothetical protein